jgi:hypothetical protein
MPASRPPRTSSGALQLPYFVRLPYESMNPPRLMAPLSDEIDIVDLAKDVLSFETGGSAQRGFHIRDRLAPGGVGEMVLSLASEWGAPPMTISLTPSDLVAGSSRIPANSIRISPSTVTVSSGISTEVAVKVLAPPGARPGVYTGTISATGDETFSVPFQAEVR